MLFKLFKKYIRKFISMIFLKNKANNYIKIILFINLLTCHKSSTMIYGAAYFAQIGVRKGVQTQAC